MSESMADYSYGVSGHHSELYRRKAAECRRQAENCLDYPNRQMWLSLADDWIKMAQEVERRTGMENPNRAEIIKRANQLWERAGSPEGRAEEFYHQAEQELLEQERSSQVPPAQNSDQPPP